MARLLLSPSATRDRLTADMFLGSPDDESVGLLERALAATIAAEPVEAKIRVAAKGGRIDATLPPGAGVEELARRAQDAGVITAAEGAALLEARDLTARVIRVDDFAQDLGASDLRLATEPAAPSATTPPTTTTPPYKHKAAA